MLVFVFLELKVVIGVHCSLTEFETVDVQEETNGILCEEIFKMVGRAGFKSFRLTLRVEPATILSRHGSIIEVLLDWDEFELDIFKMVGRAGLLGLCPRPSGRCDKRNAVSLRSART